jgi:hypothetical protein
MHALVTDVVQANSAGYEIGAWTGRPALPTLAMVVVRNTCSDGTAGTREPSQEVAAFTSSTTFASTAGLQFLSA